MQTLWGLTRNRHYFYCCDHCTSVNLCESCKPSASFVDLSCDRDVLTPMDGSQEGDTANKKNLHQIPLVLSSGAKENQAN